RLSAAVTQQLKKRCTYLTSHLKFT
ncbi:thioredoxin reductase, partial [Vibrio parahaemolyticus V-223/04]